MRIAALVLVLSFGLLLARAPVQCGTNEPRAAEDSPPEVLFDLAEELERDGDVDGRDRTLRYLVERYPSSRWAERARMKLGGEDAAGTER
jgi:outer membrane protein assembly factor BamD (BamD/ComL family)